MVNSYSGRAERSLRSRFKNLGVVAVSAITLVGIGFTSAASATAKKSQAPIHVSNTATHGTAGTGIKLMHQGGTGSGWITWHVSGAGCTIVGGILKASKPTTCSVTVSKGSTNLYKAVTSAAKSFSFAAATQSTLAISNTSLSATVGTPVTLTSTGGSGNGAVTFSAVGSNCSIQGNALNANAAATCVVTATKAASGIYNAATSASVTFTFTAAVDAPTVANPDVATLTSVGGAASAQINDTANGDNYFINSYYNNSDHWYQYYFNEGATITETWHVNGSNGQPLANAPVTLYSNLNYSSACGVTWAAPNTGLNACSNGTGSGQGSITGTTDANGNVTFTLVNTNTNTGTAPVDTTTTATAEAWENAAAGNSVDTLLQVGSDTYTGNPLTTVNQQTDRVDLLLIPAAPAPDAPTVANPDVATLTSVGGAASAQINDTANGDNYFINSYYNNSDHWYQYYFNEGATITETWHVNGSNGQPLANAPVTLYSNLNYSSACGVTWAAPNTGLNACSNGTGSGQGSITGTTDANGNVTFTLVNTNTNTGTAPVDTTTTATAEAWENAAAGNSVDTLLQVGSDTYTGNPLTTVNQQTDRVDLLLIPAPLV